MHMCVNARIFVMEQYFLGEKGTILSKPCGLRVLVCVYCHTQIGLFVLIWRLLRHTTIILQMYTLDQVVMDCC